MVEVLLTKGKVALIDDEDKDRVSQFKWSAMETDGHWYAVRSKRDGGRKISVLMHHFIIGAPAGKFVDHANGNGKDSLWLRLRTT